MIKIGIAGLAKNTGKTTFASTLLADLEGKNIPLGITSIGYDGEDIDTVTGLPKPKYLFPEGTIIATASKTLKVTPVRLKKLKEYPNIETPLGHICLLQTLSRGNVPLAGPSTVLDLGIVFKDMENYGIGVAIADGAFNRITPFTIADGLILTTGLSRTENLNTLISEVKIIEKIFTLPKFSVSNFSEGILLLNNGSTSVISKNPYQSKSQLPKDIQSGGTLVFNTFFPVSNVISLVESIKPKNIVFKDPISLVLSGKTLFEINRALEKLRGMEINIYTLKQIKLICIALNPCRIGLNPNTMKYEKKCLPPENILELFRAEVKEIPVVDVVYEKNLNLYSLIKNRLGGKHA